MAGESLLQILAYPAVSAHLDICLNRSSKKRFLVAELNSATHPSPKLGFPPARGLRVRLDSSTLAKHSFKDATVTEFKSVTMRIRVPLYPR